MRLDIERLAEIERRFSELERRLCDPAVLADPDRYQRVARERAALEEVAIRSRQYRQVLQELAQAREGACQESDREMRALFEAEVESLQRRQEDLEEELIPLLLPRDPYADKDIILEIRPAAGGEEAALFAAELLRMYLRYAERKGWKAELMSRTDTELGGLKEVVLSISGRDVYQHLRHESGVHRVQRVPATEASGRIHTSTVTVAVLPEAEEIGEVEIAEKDLKVDTYRASGAGGQHVNKTDSAVRLTHLPTGLVVTCQDERSQRQNRDKAMRILRARLLERERRRQEEELAATRRSQVGSGERSEKIRTYNFPENRVTDHRVGVKVHDLAGVLDGDLDPFVEALKARRSAELMARGGQV